MQVIECTNQALPELFDPEVPDNPVLWAVLNGRHSGRALVDNVLSPSQCVLRTDPGLTFASHQVSQEFLQHALAYLRRDGELWLHGFKWSDSGSIAPRPNRISQRIEFYDYDPNDSRLEELKARLPQGFNIQRIDRDLIERCEWRDEMKFYCGSLENFLSNALGFCLMHGQEIICEAYVSSFGATYAEIGAITREYYRGKGYAPTTCTFLLQECEQRGFHGYWSCEMDNLASIRVARKLGFRREKLYQVLEYDRLR